MKKTLVLFFFLGCFFAVSQPNTPKFVSIGTANSNEHPSAIYVNADGSYFLGGMKNDSALVMYLSNTDSIIWAKTFKFQSGSCYVNYLGMTSDSYLIGSGSCLNGGIFYCCYFKINPVNGNFIWNNNFNGNSTYQNRIIEKNVNEYICVGTEYPVMTGGTGTDNKITIVSAANGAILSQPNVIGYQPLSFSLDDLQGTTDKHPVDGSFFSTGRSYIQTATDKMRATLIKYNANGNPLWFKYVHKPASGISRMYSHDLIFVNQTQILMMYHADDNCVGGCTDYYPGLMLLDTAGNVIWDKIYNIPSSNGEISDKVCVISNQIYLAGYTNANTSNSGGPNTPNNGNVFVLKTDMNGNVLACNQYGSPILNEKPFLSNIGNGGDCRNNLFYFTYAAEDPNTGLSDINVLKLDSTMQVACYPATTLAVTAISVTPFSTSFPPVFNPAPFTTSPLSTYNTSFPNPCPASPVRSVSIISLSGNDTILSVYTATATSYYWYSNGATTATKHISPPTQADSVLIYSGCCPVMKRVFYFNFCTPPLVNVTVNYPSVYCAGSTVTLTASGANTYTLYPAGISGNVFTVNPTVTSYYMVVGAAGNCTNQAMATVSVSPQIQATFTFAPNTGGTYFVTCANPVVQISASNPALNYTWTSISSLPLSGQVNSFSHTHVGTWTITAENPTSGCKETHTMTVVQNTANPFVATLTPTLQNIDCVNSTIQSITVTAQATINIAVNVTHSFISPLGNTLNINSNPAVYGAGIGTYTYILTNNYNGCSSPPITFSILTSPGTPTFQVISTPTLAGLGNFTLGCNNHSLTVLSITNASTTPTPGGALTYSFYAPNGTLYSQNQFTVVSIPGTWTAVALSLNNNCKLSMPVSVVQNTVPPNVSADVPFSVLSCFNPTTTLTGLSNNDVSYKWTTPNGNFQNQAVTAGTVNSGNTFAGNYSLTVTDLNNGCLNSTLVVMQQNLFAPTPSISVTGSVITCLTKTLQLTNSSKTSIPNSSGFPSGNFVIATLWQAPSPQPTMELTSSYIAEMPGTYTMTVRDENNGCHSQTTATISDNKIYPIIEPLASFIDCGATTASVSVSVSPEGQNYVYAWNTGNKAYEAGTESSAVLKVMELGTYTVNVTNIYNGCSSNDSMEVTAGTLTANFVANKTQGCAPLIITFSNTSTSSLDNNNINSFWNFGNGTSQTQTFTPENIYATFLQEGNFNISLYAIKGLCSDSITKNIEVDIPANIEIPNIFTPNGDGINDIFFLKTSNLSEITAKIFDRWGHLVYEVTSETGNIVWDGKNLQGKEVSAGVYFYIIKAQSDNCGKKVLERKGTVSLIR